ncbi:MAG: PaaI family thioesterase [Maricaulaceae bacterium]
MKSQAELDALGKMCTQSIEGIRRTGVEIVSIGHGRVKLLMPLKGNENHVNMMYAGSLFSLAELPGGAVFISALDPQKYYPVVGEVTIRYLKPALTDVTVEVTWPQEEIDRLQNDLETTGKCKYILEQELKDAKGNVVAVTTATYMGLANKV